MVQNDKGLTQEFRQAVADIKSAILQSQEHATMMISGSQLLASHVNFER
jgi:hypothetical protein